jgi:hypothetical protein
MDLPIVCTLTEAELKDRRRTVHDLIRRCTIDVTPVTNGYVYRFEATSEVLASLANLVDLERQCCQFLSFKIIVEPQCPIALEITGPPPSQALIVEFFESTPQMNQQ